MTKFDQVGVTFQCDAPTREAALKAFHSSCRCCGTKGMRIDCDRCAIANTHAMIMAIFDSKNEEDK